MKELLSTFESRSNCHTYSEFKYSLCNDTDLQIIKLITLLQKHIIGSQIDWLMIDDHAGIMCMHMCAYKKMASNTALWRWRVGGVNDKRKWRDSWTHRKQTFND